MTAHLTVIDGRTEAQVIAIRDARSSGEGVRALARQYGVDHAQISRIVNRRSWILHDESAA